MSSERHWDDAYAGEAATGVSWYQEYPAMSLRLVERLATSPATSIIDVGGGASVLAEHLLARGFTDVTVLDLSARALEHARKRLGGDASRATWLREDLLAWSSARRYQLWHDRAVLHFLVNDDDRKRYAETVASALTPDGAVVIGTFALDGPSRCSGLPVVRYDAEAVADLLGGDFEIVESAREEHQIPGGSIQPFSWVALTRISG